MAQRTDLALSPCWDGHDSCAHNSASTQGLKQVIKGQPNQPGPANAMGQAPLASRIRLQVDMGWNSAHRRTDLDPSTQLLSHVWVGVN